MERILGKSLVNGEQKMLKTEALKEDYPFSDLVNALLQPCDDIRIQAPEESLPLDDAAESDDADDEEPEA